MATRPGFEPGREAPEEPQKPNSNATGAAPQVPLGFVLIEVEEISRLKAAWARLSESERAAITAILSRVEGAGT